MHVFLDLCRELLGISHLLTGDDVHARSIRWGLDVPCQAAAIARPKDTAQVSELVKLCAAHNIKMVVHGGRTGLVGAIQADAQTLVISLERLNIIESLDQDNRTLTAGAGCTLQSIQEAAAQCDLFFALDLGARGSATLGGAISTNAGGLNVIRFGMMREQVLGIEVVLPDGEIVNMLQGLIKNNTGYDLKQLFIGAEGTLGIVTRVTLRLRFNSPDLNTALLALPSFEASVKLLHRLERKLSGRVCAFEVMWPAFYQRVTDKHCPENPPLTADYPIYVILESLGEGDADRQQFLSVLEETLDAEQVLDAVIANSSRERRQIWEMREDIEALMSGGPTAHFDLGLKVQDIPAYLASVEREVCALHPHAVVMPFGHLGDNNLHLSINLPAGREEELASVKEIVYRALGKFGGSVSAEHGIGTDKKAHLAISKSEGEIALMKRLKACLDPQQLLNSELIF
ncbi:MAG: FAD-binding oxidoreductase [Pseudomonadales bacterium]